MSRKQWGKYARVPGLGRVGVVREPSGDGQAVSLFGGMGFATQLDITVFGPDGRIKQVKEYMPFWARFWANARANSYVYNAGSGLVTNIGVDNMANDFTWANGATLKQMNYCGIGTGATAAAASDYYLQTPITAGNLTGSTNGYMTGTQSWVQPDIFKNVATFTANASLAVTEWGLFNSNAANFSGTATSTGTTSLTNTGASFTTSGNGLQNWAVEASSTAVNTPTTTAWGLITTNSGTVLTIPGWLTLANAGASTPSGTTSYVVYPSMWDHKVFSVVNLNTGDSLQTSYSLTVNSGG